MIRVGHGFDVHAFGQDRPLMICGVAVPYHTGFIAHSDGDVALHALTDALLGAVALGDIGKLFPDTDMQYKNADSLKLVMEADVTIIAQAPKMRPYIDQMRQTIADDLQCDVMQVNVKATTTEKLGFTGRGEGIACEAVVLLAKI